MLVDSKFESMDELSKMIEPWDCVEYEMVMSLPDELDISEYIISNINNSKHMEPDFSIYNSEVIDIMARLLITTYSKHTITPKFRSSLEEIITLNLSSLDNEEGSREEVIIMPEDINNIKFTIKINKELFDIKKYASKLFYDQINISRNSSSRPKKKFVNDICKMFNIELSDSVKASDGRNMFYYVKQEFERRLRSDEIRVKSTQLISDLGRWLKMYAVDGNLAASMNLCQFKLMTHNGDAIYSIAQKQEV